jgi:hypothetical protein
MAISKLFEMLTRYLTEAAMEIFSPNHDNYPVIGIQPFTGEPYKQRHADSW